MAAAFSAIADAMRATFCAVHAAAARSPARAEAAIFFMKSSAARDAVFIARPTDLIPETSPVHAAFPAVADTRPMARAKLFTAPPAVFAPRIVASKPLRSAPPKLPALPEKADPATWAERKPWTMRALA